MKLYGLCSTLPVGMPRHCSVYNTILEMSKITRIFPAVLMDQNYHNVGRSKGLVRRPVNCIALEGRTGKQRKWHHNQARFTSSLLLGAYPFPLLLTPQSCQNSKMRGKNYSKNFIWIIPALLTLGPVFLSLGHELLSLGSALFFTRLIFFAGPDERMQPLGFTVRMYKCILTKLLSTPNCLKKYEAEN